MEAQHIWCLLSRLIISMAKIHPARYKISKPYHPSLILSISTASHCRRTRPQPFRHSLPLRTGTECGWRWGLPLRPPEPMRDPLSRSWITSAGDVVAAGALCTCHRPDSALPDQRACSLPLRVGGPRLFPTARAGGLCPFPAARTLGPHRVAPSGGACRIRAGAAVST